MQYNIREMVSWNWPPSLNISLFVCFFYKKKKKKKIPFELSNLFTLCFGSNTVFLTKISLVQCWWYLQISIAFFKLRNDVNPFVAAKTHDTDSLCANICPVLKDKLLFGIFLIKDMLWWYMSLTYKKFQRNNNLQNFKWAIFLLQIVMEL